MNPRQRRRRTEDVPGPVSAAVPGPGPGTPISAPAAIDPAAGAESAPYPDELVLVDERELEEIRWHSYDEAIAAAKAHRDRSLRDARERLDKATHAAYADYRQALDAVDETYDLARRAAMRAHELAGQVAP